MADKEPIERPETWFITIKVTAGQRFREEFDDDMKTLDCLQSEIIASLEEAGVDSVEVVDSGDSDPFEAGRASA